MLVSLDLSSNNLKLKNPNLTTLIGNLSSLQELFLDWVEISEEHGGKWSQVISIAMPSLQRLSLRYCGLQGPIDASLFQIPDLSQLSLDGSNLSIVVPDFLSDSSALTSLTLSDCGLYGEISKSIFLRSNLQNLDVSDNPHLTIDFLEFPQNKALRSLFLGNTTFQKRLLDSINNLKFLKELSAPNCNLSGSLPSSIANLIQLEYMDLSSNNFSGTLPSSYGVEFKHLISLYLYNNSLEGAIPSSLFSHPTLRYLDLSYNQFSGYLPNSHNESSSMLEGIYLNNNKLQGAIPRLVFELTKLRYLSLSDNNFSGEGSSNSSSNVQVVKYQINSGNATDYQDSVTVTMKGLDLEVVKIITALTGFLGQASVPVPEVNGHGPETVQNWKMLEVSMVSSKHICLNDPMGGFMDSQQPTFPMSITVPQASVTWCLYTSVNLLLIMQCTWIVLQLSCSAISTDSMFWFSI
ncbi:hypothetical protein AAC387_Pa07g1751 [Persea americana]